MTAGIGTSVSATRRRIVFLVYDKVTLQDVATSLEVLARANDFGAGYDVLLASPTGRSVDTTSFLRLGVDVEASALVDDLDTVIIPGGVPPDSDPQTYAKPEEPTPDTIPALVDAASRLVQRSKRIASMCTGAFVLARLGVLDRRRATTHWAHCEQLAERYPRVEVDPDALFVRDGPVVTGAGVCASIDLTLALVEDDYGADLARRVARWLVIFLRRPGGQNQFSVWSPAYSGDSDQVREVMDEVMHDPAGDHSTAALARRAAVSEDHLTESFTQAVGMPPARYVERVRIEAAKLMLSSSEASLEAVAASCGFDTAALLSDSFLQSLGISPRDYRQRFRSTGVRPARPGIVGTARACPMTRPDVQRAADAPGLSGTRSAEVPPTVG
ncbi:GlxA family transcriptional regulator [Streptomyces flaveolus]|uniref:GlxA family transcriptional regulator n=1 Tax=Streptomyces flaveolus TaxID=67297 RepID=UPI0034496185